MLTLLVSATEFEIAETALWLNNSRKLNNAGNPELLISGIGQLQTAYALQKKIQTRRPGLIIQAGIGGSVIPENLGKSFVILSEEIADLGVMENDGFRNIFEMGLAAPDKLPFSKGKLMNPFRVLLDWSGLPQAEGVTVNEIKSENFAGIQRNNIPVVESMEGAALHYVCLMENIPFLQIRSISNMLGERDKTRWKLKEAIGSLNKSLVSLIQKLEQADETLFRI
jgi:futalosine hydrolase